MDCIYCGGSTKHRDYVKRLVKRGGGEKEWIKVERVICTSCNKLHRVLPDSLMPYKHYEKEIIEGVKTGEIAEDEIRFEDYPSDITKYRWKNRNDIHFFNEKLNKEE